MARKSRNIPLNNGWFLKAKGNGSTPSDKDVYSFYVTNFPETADNNLLRKTFDSYGYLTNVYIARKRAKTGKRFGFVKFMGVKNVLEMENRMADIWIGNHHLFVESSKIDKPTHNSSNDNRAPGQKKLSAKVHVYVPKPQQFITISKESNIGVDKSEISVQKHTGSDGSYASAIKGDKQATMCSLNNDDIIRVSDNDHIVMGKVKDIGTLFTIYQQCIVEGFSEFKIQYIEGLWVWFLFDSIDACARFKASPNMLSLFACLKEPSDMFVVDERIVWIEINGLPTCAWGTNAGKKVVSLFGRFLFFESNCKLPLSTCRVCIATYDKHPISSVRNVEIDKSNVEVVVQEVDTWLFALIRQLKWKRVMTILWTMKMQVALLPGTNLPKTHNHVLII
ncbi:uncharacterized protein [Rutidosis leptorrhynchoides]|uniref:uncharacterized protein n=1 Tax=Rutidosis leptorrhynchoides TaxID=125765 RepID=UPI003A991090